MTDYAMNMARALAKIREIADFPNTPGGDMLPDLMGRLETIFQIANGEEIEPLKSSGDSEWALRQGDVLADWCNVAGAALKAMMDAYERRIRSLCNADQIKAEVWRCAEFIQAEHALATKPVAVVALDVHKPGGEIPEAPYCDCPGWCLSKDRPKPVRCQGFQLPEGAENG